MCIDEVIVIINYIDMMRGGNLRKFLQKKNYVNYFVSEKYVKVLIKKPHSGNDEYLMIGGVSDEIESM